MKPILIFAIAAVVATAIGVGSLNNTITLIIQQFGVGEGDIESPITSAAVDFRIEAVTVGEGNQAELKNLITACSFHTNEDMEAGSEIICKLTDAQGKVVAEGTLTLATAYQASQTLSVPITIFAYPGSNSVTNIHDVILIVSGPEPQVPPQAP
jgi:hypothetical protein